MANKDNKKGSNVTIDVVPESVSTSAAPTTVPVATPENTALTVAAPTPVSAVALLTDPENPYAELIARIPKTYVKQAVALANKNPLSRLEIAINNLPEALKLTVQNLLSRARPQKQGAHDTNESFAPFMVKLFHGTGTDPSKPKSLAVGHFYGSNSKDLGEEFTGAILGFYKGRKMWPLRDASGEVPDGVSKAPACYSFDSKTGSKYGSCLICPNSNVPYNKGGCQHEVTALLIDSDFSGLYSLTFSRTSLGAGKGLIKTLAGSANLWENYFTFKSAEQKSGTKRWFTIETHPVKDTKNPENEKTPAAIQEVFQIFSEILDLDVFYRGVADANSRFTGNNSGPAANTFDEAAALAAAGVEGNNPDYGTTPNV